MKNSWQLISNMAFFQISTLKIPKYGIFSAKLFFCLFFLHEELNNLTFTRFFFCFLYASVFLTSIFQLFSFFKKKVMLFSLPTFPMLLGVAQFWWISPISQFAKFLSRYCLLPILNQSLIWKLFHLLSKLFHYSTIESTRKTS